MPLHTPSLAAEPDRKWRNILFQLDGPHYNCLNDTHDP